MIRRFFILILLIIIIPIEIIIQIPYMAIKYVIIGKDYMDDPWDVKILEFFEK